MWLIVPAWIAVFALMAWGVAHPPPKNHRPIEPVSEEPFTYSHHEVRCNSIAPPVNGQLCSRGRWTQGI